MRVLLIADAGDGLLDLALIAQRQGHKVRFFCRKYDPQTRPIGKGLVERVDNWRAHMDWSDLVVLEANGVYMAEMDLWRRRGCRIIGGNAESAAWELDRTKGMQIFKKAGIAVPPYREFSDYGEAINYVERKGQVFYSKPCSDTADKSLSAKTGIQEDPSWMLRKWRKKQSRPPSPFLLQEPVEGTEFAVGAWFGPGGFADDGVEENFEHKKLFAGDIGPNCGEAGTVMRYTKRSKLAAKVLFPLEEQLHALGYCGNIDINTIVDASGAVWPLEFTMRLGWPAFNIECALLEEPIEFLHALASGESARGFHRMNDVAVGVVMALPPYPSPPRDYDEIIGVPLYGDLAGWHPCEMQQGPHEHQEAGCELASAGGYIGVGTGVGFTVRQAARKAYDVLGHLSMPSSPFWRNDIGRRLQRDLPKLQEYGFATGMEY